MLTRSSFTLHQDLLHAVMKYVCGCLLEFVLTNGVVAPPSVRWQTLAIC